MVRDGVKGKLVFTSSVLGYFSMVGYAPYSPGKFAVRGTFFFSHHPTFSSLLTCRPPGLAEALQSEFLLYGIDVHISFPATILSPGFVEENKVKPKITLKLEETDVGTAPEAVAAHVLRGVQAGRFHITYGFIGHVFRCATRGSSPGSNGLLDQVYVLIGAVRCRLLGCCAACADDVAPPDWAAAVEKRRRQGGQGAHRGALRVPARQGPRAAMTNRFSLFLSSDLFFSPPPFALLGNLTHMCTYKCPQNARHRLQRGSPSSDMYICASAGIARGKLSQSRLPVRVGLCSTCATHVGGMDVESRRGGAPAFSRHVRFCSMYVVTWYFYVPPHAFRNLGKCRGYCRLTI